MLHHKNIFVMVGAFLSILLLMVARHHPPSRRKIKEIWHGRVYWERESNTTMLRSSLRVINTTVDTTADTADTTADTIDTVIDTTVPAPKKFDIELAVIVLTARNYKERREVIRETWGNSHSNVFFVVGKHCPYKPDQRKSWVCEPKDVNAKIDENYNAQQDTLTAQLSKEPNVIMVDMIDVYRNLAEKLKLAYIWIIGNTEAKYVLKMDDDSFARVDSVGHWVKNRQNPPEYEIVAGGFSRGSPSRRGKWAETKYKPDKYPPWPSGAGHIVSRPVIEYLHQNTDTWVSYQGEDTSLGIWMEKVRPQMDVKRTSSEHFITHSGDCHNKNKFVIGHSISLHKMRECYKTLDEYESLDVNQSPINENKLLEVRSLYIDGYALEAPQFAEALFNLPAMPYDGSVESHPNDILLVGMDGIREKKLFKGKTVMFNGESKLHDGRFNGNTYYIGPTKQEDQHHLQVYYAAYANLLYGKGITYGKQSERRIGHWQKCSQNEYPECLDMGWPWTDKKRDPRWQSARLSEKNIGSVKNRVVVDIGANDGRDASTYLSRGAKSLILLEPMMENVKKLRNKFGSNHNVKIIHTGVGSHYRESFIVSRGNSGEASYEQTKESSDSQKIQVRDIVEIFSQTLKSDDKVFLAINCEGCEYEVLERLANYENGAYLLNGTIRQINMAAHGADRNPLEKIKSYCSVLNILQTYWSQTYCSGPWIGWIWRENVRRDKFMSYVQRKCHKYRESAFDTIVDFMQKNSPTSIPVAGGKCYGSHKNLHQPKKTRHWSSNGNKSNFRFNLVMENKNSPGYITEKIMMAFLSGSIPIYYGTNEVYNLFNKDAFIYYDIENPTPALERILYLEKNVNAYEHMLAQPMFADGALEKYFSLSDDIGGGKLKQRIHNMVINSNFFFSAVDEHKYIKPVNQHEIFEKCAMDTHITIASYKDNRNQNIMEKIRKMMDSLNFVWWLDQGGLIQSARGDKVFSDPDIDIAYMPRLGPMYSKCSKSTRLCSEQQQNQIYLKFKEISEKLFPELKFKQWGMHITLLRGGKKIIDFAPMILTEDERYVKSGFGTKCGDIYKGSGWPCTHWNITDIFPLQRCWATGISVPCPAKLVPYITKLNQREYIDDGIQGQRCHGCSKCLLWDSATGYNARKMEETRLRMEKLNICGFGTLLNLKISNATKNGSPLHCDEIHDEVKWCPRLPDSDKIIVPKYKARSFVPGNDIYRTHTLLQKCHIMEMNLKAITNVLNENCLYHLEGGTLISLLRDKRINPRDSDHDIALYNCKSKWPTVIKKLTDMGFTHCRSVSLCRYGQYTDFTHMKMKTNKCSRGSARTAFPCSLIFPLQLHVGSNMYIPYNPDAYLSSFYDNWKVYSTEHRNSGKIKTTLSSTPAAGQVLKTWIQLLSSENQLVFNFDNYVRVKSKANSIEILKNGPFEFRYHNNTVYYSNKVYFKLT